MSIAAKTQVDVPSLTLTAGQSNRWRMIVAEMVDAHWQMVPKNGAKVCHMVNKLADELEMDREDLYWQLRSEAYDIVEAEKDASGCDWPV